MRFIYRACVLAIAVWLNIVAAFAQINTGGGGGNGTVTSVATSCGIAGGPITATGTVSGNHPTNTQSGTTYTIASSDCGKLVTSNNSGAVAWTLPSPATLGAGFHFWVQNIGTGSITLTPTSSTINLVSFITIPQNVGYFVANDGTNWYLEGTNAVSSLTITQAYTTPGCTQATVPSGVTYALFRHKGAGGGGGSGREGATSTYRSGGGGGAGGGIIDQIATVAQLGGNGASFPVCVGAGGIGGAAVPAGSPNTDGNPGLVGGATGIGTVMQFTNDIQPIALNSVDFFNNLLIWAGGSGVNGAVVQGTNNFGTTAASGTGTVATISFGASGGSTGPKLAVGSTVYTSGITPTGYNCPSGCTITASTGGTFSYANTTTGAQTVAGVVSTGGIIQTSPNATTTPTNQTDAQPQYVNNGICHNSTTVMIVGQNGKIETSTNGTAWTLQTSGTTNALLSCTWDNINSRFIIVGAAGTIITATSGLVFTTNAYSSANGISDVCTDGAGNDMATDTQGNAITTNSPTGTWTAAQITGNTGINLQSCAFGNGKWLAISAVSGNVWVATTSTGAWTPTNTGYAGMAGIRFVDNYFWMGTPGGFIPAQYTPDGVNYYRSPTGQNAGFGNGVGIAAYDGTNVAFTKRTENSTPTYQLYYLPNSIITTFQSYAPGGVGANPGAGTTSSAAAVTNPNVTMYAISSAVGAGGSTSFGFSAAAPGGGGADATNTLKGAGFGAQVYGLNTIALPGNAGLYPNPPSAGTGVLGNLFAWCGSSGGGGGYTSGATGQAGGASGAPCAGGAGGSGSDNGFASGAGANGAQGEEDVFWH